MKKFVIIIALCLLSAGCNFFSQPLPAGIVKTVNGGVDWQFANKVKGNASVTMVGLSISKLAFDQGNRQTVLAGTYNDGLFKSEDSGGSWSKILSKIFVYDFAISPLDVKIIYAAGICVDHGCVLKTTDGGASWNEAYHEGSASNAVRGIALNPFNPNQIVIGTASGSVMKSADAGQTWQLAKNFNDQVNRILWQNNNVYILLKTKGLFSSAGFADNFIDISLSLSKTNNIGDFINTQNSIESFSQVYVDLTSPTLIYLTTNNGLYKTVDGGKIWTQQKLPIKPDKSVARAIAISKISSNIVFTSVGATIYKSLDGGTSWQTQGITGVGGFVNYILVDPQLPQIVYAGIYASQ